MVSPYATDFVTPLSSCPRCGELMSAAEALPGNSEGPPEPGCFTICGACAALLVFGQGLIVRQPTKDETDALDPEQRRRIVFGQNRVLAVHSHKEMPRG